MEYTNVYWIMSGYPYLLPTSSSAHLFHYYNNPLSSIIAAHTCIMCGHWGMSNLSFIGHISKGRWAIAISSTDQSGAVGIPPVSMLEPSLMLPTFQALSSHRWTPVTPWMRLIYSIPVSTGSSDKQYHSEEWWWKDAGQEIETLGWGWFHILLLQCEEKILLGTSGRSWCDCRYMWLLRDGEAGAGPGNSCERGATITF